MLNKNTYSIINYILFGLGCFLLFPTLNDSFSSDTIGFLTNSPYRQPFYGIFLRTASSIGLDWHDVKLIQLIVLISSSTWFISQLIQLNKFGNLAAIFFIIHFLAFAKIGLLSISSSLIVEGWYLSLLLFIFGCALNWVRTQNSIILIFIVVTTVLTTQLKTAALLVLLSLIPLFLLINKIRNKSYLKFNITIIIITAFLSIVFLPLLMNKPILKITTTQNRLGFVILPRISLLQTPIQYKADYAQWDKLSNVWRKQAPQLNLTEFISLDATLQEHIRYKLYPTELLPIQKNIPTDQALKSWATGEHYDDALTLAEVWIINDLVNYLKISWRHFIGLMSYSTLLQTSELKTLDAVFDIINSQNSTSPKLRYDYPTNLTSNSISTMTSICYYYLRGLGLFFLLSMVFITCLLIKNILCLKQIRLAHAVYFYIGSFAILQSLPAAFTVFPEFRYVMVNMVISTSALASWFCILLNNKRKMNYREISRNLH